MDWKKVAGAVAEYAPLAGTLQCGTHVVKIINSVLSAFRADCSSSSIRAAYETGPAADAEAELALRELPEAAVSFTCFICVQEFKNEKYVEYKVERISAGMVDEYILKFTCANCLAKKGGKNK